MASPLCVNTVYKEWVKVKHNYIIIIILYTHINCKDARGLDILVFSVSVFCLFFFFCFLVSFSMFLVLVFLVWGFWVFLGFWGFCFGVFDFVFWFLFLFSFSLL